VYFPSRQSKPSVGNLCSHHPGQPYKTGIDLPIDATAGAELVTRYDKGLYVGLAAYTKNTKIRASQRSCFCRQNTKGQAIRCLGSICVGMNIYKDGWDLALHLLLPHDSLVSRPIPQDNLLYHTYHNPHFNMQLSSILYLGTLLTTTSAITVSYDPGYDIGSRSLAVVSCSNGSHGLLTKATRPKLRFPDFLTTAVPRTIEGWNSANCGNAIAWLGRHWEDYHCLGY